MRPFLNRPTKPFFKKIIPLGRPLKGKIFLPGDKSISHRAVIISSLAIGNTVIKNFSFNNDCLATISALKALGVRISTDLNKKIVLVRGKGPRLKKPSNAIFTGESGTTFRMLLGVLAGQGFTVKLTAAKSLSGRPMKRVSVPLRLMGANIKSRRANNEEYPPLTIYGGNLKSITYKMPISSAQVKSAILLAGLYSKGNTVVIEPARSRDHTERMLKLFKADIKVKGLASSITGGKTLKSPGVISVPSDISSASFFIVAALLIKGSEITLKSVSLNPARIGIIKVLKRMGANIIIKKTYDSVEPKGDIIARYSSLKEPRSCALKRLIGYHPW